MRLVRLSLQASLAMACSTGGRTGLPAPWPRRGRGLRPTLHSFGEGADLKAFFLLLLLTRWLSGGMRHLGLPGPM